METFLVGGAVRDFLLDIEHEDRDFVVVGSSVEEMLSLGFKQVGKDFPVFLHPETGEEYALARRERSTGPSYTCFDFDVEGVTLEEDLSRRDLTINAMAMDIDGTLIDPFGGQQDLIDKMLCATSDAFSEDPLRVLRVGRFLARMGDGWNTDLETAAKMVKMLHDGSVGAVSPDRIWQETVKAIMEPEPWRFLLILCTAKNIRLSLGQKHNLETTLRLAVKQSLPAMIRWSVFLSCLDVQGARTLNEDIKVPVAFRRMFTRSLVDITGATTAQECLDVVLKLNCVHNDKNLFDVMDVLSCLLHKLDLNRLFRKWFLVTRAAKSVEGGPFLGQGLTGAQIGAKVLEERLKRIEEVLK